MKAWKKPRYQDHLSIGHIVKASHLGKPTPSKIPKPGDLGKDTWTFLVPLADDAWNLAGRPFFENAFQVEAFLCSVVANAPGFNAYTLTNRDSRAEVNLHIRRFRNYLSMPNGQSDLHAAAPFYSSALGSHAPSANARGFIDYYRTRASQFFLWHSQYVLKTRHRAVEEGPSEARKSIEPVITTWKPDELSAEIANVTGWFIRSSAVEAQLMGLPSEGLVWRATLRAVGLSESDDDLFCLQAVSEYRQVWESFGKPSTRSHAEVESLLASILLERIVEWDKSPTKIPNSVLLKQYLRMREFANFVARNGAVSGFGRALSKFVHGVELSEDSAFDWALARMNLVPSGDCSLAEIEDPAEADFPEAQSWLGPQLSEMSH